MWTRTLLTAAIASLSLGCAPRLQVSRWQDLNGVYAASIRCTAYGRTVQAELATDATLSVRPPTPALEEP
jgi:hypothetical protein